MKSRKHPEDFQVLVSYNRELDQGPTGSHRNRDDEERGRQSGEWKWASETEKLKVGGAGQHTQGDP